MSSPASPVIHFANWARNQRSSAAAWARPKTEAEVQACVRDALRAGTRVKVVGAAHSWSDIAMSANASTQLLSLDEMGAGSEGIIELEQIDEESAHVEVWAGTRLSQLNEELAARGWAMPILGSVAAQSLAGVIATGTHGSSLHQGNLSTLVEAITLVDGRGELRRLDSEEDLEFARVSLGALGVFTRVRLRVCRAFNLEEKLTRVPWEKARHTWRERLEAAPFLKIWWLPPSDDLLFFEYTPTTETPKVNRLAEAVDKRVVNPWIFPLLLRLGGAFPKIVHPINRLIHKLRFAEQVWIDRSDRRFTLAMPPVHREVEYALPLERGFEGLDAMRALVREQGVAVNIIQELRFVKADSSWMSPAQGRDSAQLGAYLANSPHLEAYFQGFETRMLELDGRPHWGKEFEVLDHEDIARLWPKAGEFSQRAAEFDPEGIFRNHFLERVLGP